MVPAARTIQYGYAQTGWKDLMTSYNGQSITYDEIGNPLTYRDGMTMTWTGRQLTTLSQNGKQNTYKYDVDGLRLEKTAGGVTTQYQYVNGQLLGEKRSNGVILRYTYDALGVLSGIQYKNAAGVTTNYIVRCTLSGDMDQIFDTKGSLMFSAFIPYPGTYGEGFIDVCHYFRRDIWYMFHLHSDIKKPRGFHSENLSAM